MCFIEGSAFKNKLNPITQSWYYIVIKIKIDLETRFVTEIVIPIKADLIRSQVVHGFVII